MTRLFLIAPSRKDLVERMMQFDAGPRLKGVNDFFKKRHMPPINRKGFRLVWAIGKPDSKGEMPRENFVNSSFAIVLQGSEEYARELLEKTVNKDNADENLGDTDFIGTDFETYLNAPAIQRIHSPPGRFGTERNMKRLIGAQSLGRLTGHGVNVVIVDQGLDSAYVGPNYVDGLTFVENGVTKLPGMADRPYQKARLEHGNAMARRILSLAPGARIFDAPFIPERIKDVASAAAMIASGYEALPAFFIRMKAEHNIDGPWVIVSPWGIYDRLAESLQGDYTQRRSHPLNSKVDRLARRHDIIFSAGNNGQFAPARRAGPYDRGPNRSIWGANALARVVSVGAVRVDALWSGTSSQGPGPRSFAAGRRNIKPDLCAPAWYTETADRGVVNTGTSTAAAVVAGTVAALRQRWDVTGAMAVSPREMRLALRDGAVKRISDSWNDRTGEGVLSVPATIARLRTLTRTRGP